MFKYFDLGGNWGWGIVRMVKMKYEVGYFYCCWYFDESVGIVNSN